MTQAARRGTKIFRKSVGERGRNSRVALRLARAQWFGDTRRMSRRFTITIALCIVLFLSLNALRLLTGPPARVDASGRRTIGFPFPVKVENVHYSAVGPVVTVIKDQPWI